MYRSIIYALTGCTNLKVKSKNNKKGSQKMVLIDKVCINLGQRQGKHKYRGIILSKEKTHNASLSTT